MNTLHIKDFHICAKPACQFEKSKILQIKTIVLVTIFHFFKVKW